MIPKKGWTPSTSRTSDSCSCARRAVIASPRTYQTDVTILTQNNALQTLVNPNRPRLDNESLTRAVEELIRRHDAVMAVVKDSNLLDLREARRAPIMRLKDKLFGALGPKPTEADLLEANVALVEKNLTVT